MVRQMCIPETEERQDMQQYKNLGGDSSITAYEPIPGGIRVEFGHDAVYEYTADKLGSEVIQKMLGLAAAGQGLCSYINRNPQIRKGYTRRIV